MHLSKRNVVGFYLFFTSWYAKIHVQNCYNKGQLLRAFQFSSDFSTKAFSIMIKGIKNWEKLFDRYQNKVSASLQQLLFFNHFTMFRNPLVLDKLELSQYLRIFRVFIFSFCRGWWFEGILFKDKSGEVDKRKNDWHFIFLYLLQVFAILVCHVNCLFQIASSAA